MAIDQELTKYMRSLVDDKDKLKEQLDAMCESSSAFGNPVEDRICIAQMLLGEQMLAYLSPDSWKTFRDELETIMAKYMEGE